MVAPYRLLACLALAAWTAGAAPSPASGQANPGPAPTAGAARGVPVAMAAQPGTPLDRTARSLVAQDLAEASRSNEAPLLLVGSARLGAASDRPVLFVQLQSPRECGSAGCSTSAYAWIKDGRGGGRWAKVLDGVSGQVTVARTKRRGMADLFVDAAPYAWNGAAYASVQPAPAVDLRPRVPVAQ